MFVSFSSDQPLVISGGLWLSGSDAAHALGQASLSPMFEGEGLSPVRNVGFFPPVCDTDLIVFQESANTHTHTHTRTHACTHTRMHAHTHTHTHHTHTYTHTHSHTHTYF